MDKARLETFSDGIFAIAITLLVFTIAQPVAADYHNLPHFLAVHWPSLATYALSFVIIGIMWLNHHSIFRHLHRVDGGCFYFNLILLMTIAFLPYPTGVFGEALRRGHGASAAAVFYSATMLVNAFAWSGLWLHASRGRRLLGPTFPESERRASTFAFTIGTAVYAVSVGIALVNAYACLAFHAALAVYYALDPLSRRVRPEAVTPPGT